MTEPAADTRRRQFQQTQGSPRGAKAVAASGAASAGLSRIRPGATAFTPRREQPMNLANAFVRQQQVD